MARSKFDRSQNAHHRLANKYINKSNPSTFDKHKGFYHYECYKAQQKLDRVLTRKEKRVLWNS